MSASASASARKSSFLTCCHNKRQKAKNSQEKEETIFILFLLLLPRPRLRMLRNKKRNVKLQAAKKKTSWLKKSKSFVNPWNSIRKLRLRSRPVTVGCSWRRRDQSHLKTLCSFIHEGEPTQLIDVAAIHSWADVEEQLQAKTLPVLKEYLSTRCKPDDIPSRKAAAISKVVSLIRDALPSWSWGFWHYVVISLAMVCACWFLVRPHSGSLASQVLPQAVFGWYRWVDAAWTLSVRERSITALVDSAFGCHLLQQLSGVSVAIMSFGCLFLRDRISRLGSSSMAMLAALRE